jgi:hypothetical protein
MKIEIRVVLDVPDDFDEKVMANDANYLSFCYANEFMSLLKFWQSKQGINLSINANDAKNLTEADFMCLSKRYRSQKQNKPINIT